VFSVTLDIGFLNLINKKDHRNNWSIHRYITGYCRYFLIYAQPCIIIFRNFWDVLLNRMNMKKLIVVGLSLMLVTGVSAQYHYRGGFYARPRVSIGIGFGVPFSPFYGGYYGYSPFFGYPPLGYGYPYGYPYGYGYGYRNGYRPSKLDLQIRDIKNDYANRIYMVKHDKTIKRKERKKQIHELEHDRDKAIIQAQKDYYEKPAQPQRRHNFNSNSSNTDNG